MCATKFECEQSSVAYIQVVQSDTATATTPSQATTSNPFSALSTKTSFSSHNTSKAEALSTPINPQENSELQKTLNSGPVAVEASKAEPVPDASREVTTPDLISPSSQESPSATSPQEAPPSPIMLTQDQEEADEEGDDEYDEYDDEYNEEYDEGDEEFDNEIDDGNHDRDEPNRGYGADGAEFGPLTDGVVRLFMFHGYYAGELRILGLKMSLEGSRCAANDIANVNRLFNL
ncbi:hypothetical protein BDD12DRAFT_806162 [Trichophaea hybrida]|nr:hypothetical protein BDD12DRAFT_806162 [Trichophaea hybrida]